MAIIKTESQANPAMTNNCYGLTAAFDTTADVRTVRPLTCTPVTFPLSTTILFTSERIQTSTPFLTSSARIIWISRSVPP